MSTELLGFPCARQGGFRGGRAVGLPGRGPLRGAQVQNGLLRRAREQFDRGGIGIDEDPMGRVEQKDRIRASFEQRAQTFVSRGLRERR